MVEQITISPEEVRGYGNVCEEHELDDFTVNVSSLSKVSEEVHGALTTTYKLLYSVYGLMFDFDKGAKQLYLQTNEANTLSLGFDTANKQLYLVDVDDTGFNLGFDPDTRELYITDEAPPIISISASSPYLVSGETTDLVVSLVNEFGSPVSGKTVTISDGTSSYSGLTNLNGTFTLYDVTVSANTTYTATYSTVSDSVNVYYATKYDYGTNSNNSNIWTKRSSDSTGLERLTDHSRMYELGTLDAYIDTAVTAPCTIEYDFKQTSNFIRWGVNVLNSSSSIGFALGDSITGTDDWHHIKIEISSTGATFKADNGTTVSKTLANINTFRFRTNNEISELFFKNFVIY